MTPEPATTWLLEFLANDFSVDGWSDYGRPVAADMLQKLDADGWATIAAEAPQRSAAWRIRLAEATIDAARDERPRVLEQLLEAPEPEVGAAAARSLLAIGYHWDPNHSLRQTLERHLTHADEPNREPLEELLARLPT